MSRKIQLRIPSVAAVVIALIMSLTIVLPSCTKKAKTLSQPAQSFINLVLRIKTPITVDSAAEIESGYVLYEYIPEKDKEDKTVTESKQTLDGYKSEYTVKKAEKDAADEAARQEVLKERFINAVAGLPAKLTVEDKTAVQAAYAVYEQLSEQSRNDINVKQSLRKLEKAENDIKELEHLAHLAEVEKTATEFIESVDALCGEDGEGEITLESRTAIEKLINDYKYFSDEVKEFEGVAEAKQKLDGAYEEYRVLKDQDDIEKLLECIEKLPPAEEVTLDNKKDIEDAEYIYQYMSDNAKSDEGVAEAYEKLAAARAKYDELFEIAENERIQIFIAAAEKVPADIENADISWFEVLEAAKNAYWDLTYKSQQLPEVEEAFKRWNAAQKAFDKKGYKQLPMNNPIIQVAGDGNIVLAGEFENQAVTKPLFAFYGAETKAELDEVAILWLHVYADGEYQGKVAIRFTDIGGPGHLIMSATVVNALKTLAEENTNVHSGASFAFALSYEDKDGTMVIPSEQSKVSGQHVYTW